MYDAWIVLFHRGEYYRICRYDDMDSLGSEIVDEILKPDRFEELTETWRRLLDLGSVTKMEENYKKIHALQPPNDGTTMKEEWTKLCASIDDSGPVSRWFVHERDLTAHHHEVLFSYLVRCNTECIYLINLDDNEFSACSSDDVSLICIYPFRQLREKVKSSEKWVEMFDRDEEGRRTAFRFENLYPWPKHIVEPLRESIMTSGYKVLQTVSESLSAVVYHAQSISNPSKHVYLKIFFSFQASYRGTQENYVTWDRSLPVAKVIMDNPHPNIVTVLETTTFAGHPSLVLEPYDGSLEKLDLKCPNGREDYVLATAQAACGVAHLHRMGMVHRDVKPRNVLFRKDKDGIHAAVCDFESICVPKIHKIPAWDNLGSQIFAQGGRNNLSDFTRDWLLKHYTRFLKKTGKADSLDNFASFAAHGKLGWSQNILERADIHADHVVYKRRDDCENIDIFCPDFESVRVPLKLSETFFEQLDWGPYARARTEVVTEPWYLLPVWEAGWEERRSTKAYAKHCGSENTGGCSPWILDSYSLNVMLDEVVQAKNDSRGTEANCNDGETEPGVEELEHSVRQMKAILENTVDTEIRKGPGMYEKVISVLPLAVANLEKLDEICLESSQETKMKRKTKRARKLHDTAQQVKA